MYESPAKTVYNLHGVFVIRETRNYTGHNKDTQGLYLD